MGNTFLGLKTILSLILFKESKVSYFSELFFPKNINFMYFYLNNLKKVLFSVIFMYFFTCLKKSESKR